MAKTLVYQLYPLSWPDGLRGMTEHLSRIATLGADYVWLSPIYDSPLEDGGYDVANYKTIKKRFKKEGSFHEFVEQAHTLGLGVLMDLPINHTSIRNRWFDSHPEYYCWSKRDHPGWKNLFDGGSSWQYSKEDDLYYLHLFHQTQADLNWFPTPGDRPLVGVSDRLNWPLVYEFQSIVEYWVNRGVDGFRIDFPQGINKDFGSEVLDLEDLLYGYKATEVVNAIFEDEDLFLIMECFDPTMGEITEYYSENTSVDFVMNVLLKNEAKTSNFVDFYDLIAYQANNPHFMLDLESHDGPRFPSRGISPKDMLWYMFNSNVEGICLYQGQELGLYNPSRKTLPDAKLLKLDVQAAMRYIKGEELDSLRPFSRANARIEIPLDEYAHQEQDGSSILNLTKGWIQRWRIGNHL